MDTQKLIERAMEIRQHYAEFELKKYGRSWTKEELALGLVGDVGDLMKLVLAKSNIREINDVDDKLAHEISDCLWSLLVLSKMYDLNIEAAFMRTMNELEKSIAAKMKSL